MVTQPSPPGSLSYSEVLSSSPLKVVILGHSFVCRTSDFINQDKLGALHNFGLSPTTHTISFISRPGGKARNMNNAYSQIQAIEPDLVLLDIGTNDLQSSSPSVLVSRVYIIFRTLVHFCNVLQVLFMVVIGPLSPSNLRWQHLWSHVFKNKICSIHGRTPVPICYWYHKGFATNWESFITDGVHLNPQGVDEHSLCWAVLKFFPSVHQFL